MFTYDPTLLQTLGSASALPRLRLVLGDTDVNNQLFQDEELNYFLTVRATEYGAAAEAARTMSARSSSSVDMAMCNLSGRFSQAQTNWAARALEFDYLSAVAGGVIPYMGGMTYTDMALQDDNPDRVPMQYSIGMDDSYLPVAPIPPGTNNKPGNSQ